MQSSSKAKKASIFVPELRYESTHHKKEDAGNMCVQIPCTWAGNTHVHFSFVASWLLWFFSQLVFCERLCPGKSPVVRVVARGDWCSSLIFLFIVPAGASWNCSPGRIGGEVLSGSALHQVRLINDEAIPLNPISWFYYILRIHCLWGPFSTCLPVSQRQIVTLGKVHAD